MADDVQTKLNTATTSTMNGSQRSYDATSHVEDMAVKASGRKLIYPPTEKIKIVEVPNFPMLGKLAALRFIEWVQKNPGGVISLPTGKTPEHFIKWIVRILDRWETKEIQKLLEASGIDHSVKPDMKSLSFVQIDEFYPMDASQQNSFHWYVNEFYIKGFGLTPSKALLINATSLGLPAGRTMHEVFPGNIVDLSLRVRQTKSELERLQREVINRVDEWCMEYETKIRSMGGIGFFLGGIGPDGHIAFNVRGSSIHSVTRLTGTNYETQAAAATDLGGIEISRNRLVITIGLATITYNPTATAIIIAAGDAKAPIVASAIEQKKSPRYPASVLQDLPNARFYLTKGAASLLVERRFEDFSSREVTAETVEDTVFSISLATGKATDAISNKDFSNDRFGTKLLERTGKPFSELVTLTTESAIKKIDRGLASVSNTVFLHTEPHHDDVMLAYMAHIYHLVRDPSNKHYFGNLTSGFTSVSNAYFLSILERLEHQLEGGTLSSLLYEGYFDPKDHGHRMEDVYLFLNGTAAKSQEMKDEAESRRLMRNLVEAYQTTDLVTLRNRVYDLMQYLHTQYPGAKDTPQVQTLKGMIREWEVEILWAYIGIESNSVSALRLGFYKGDIFSEEPEVDRDVLPILSHLKQIRPHIVSVAFDPEGSGPDTHYKAMQAVAEALRLYSKETGETGIKIWGYRNVWYRFRPAECNLMIPVSLNSLSMMHAAFMNCFGSQSAASFPSYEHDGPFSELAQQIQVEQYKYLETFLGSEFFQKNNHPRLRAARGMIYMREMDLDEFFQRVRELKKMTEDRI
ncbi:MAG TPA: glucosamine-6-phosphate deaminase [Bacteroidota bacterium]